MLKSNDERRKLLDAIKGNVKDPFVVVDQNGNIMLFNKEAEGLLSLEKKQMNIFDIFEDKSAEKINVIFQKFFASNSPVTDSIQLELNSGTAFTTSITLHGIMEKDEVILLLTLKLESYQFSNTGKTNLQIKINDIDKIVHNPLLLDILEEIKAKFPFTFIHKEMIRKRLNELKERFWIKDIEGNFILINKVVASSLKLKSSQVEGKNESVFIPFHLVGFQKSISKFIQESLNYVVLDGNIFPEADNTQKWETIELPLCDNSNKVVAIVGIIQEKKDLGLKSIPNLKDEEKQITNTSDLRFDTFLNKNPMAIVIFDNENLQIIDANNKAIELYGYEKTELLSKDLSDLYSTEDVQTILDQSFEDGSDEKFIGPLAHKKKDQTLFYVEVCKIPFKKDDKSFSFYIIKDVTQELEKNINDKIAQSVYINTTDLVFTTDQSGFVISINENVEKTLGYTEDELQNSSFAALLKNEDRTEINRHVFNSEVQEPLNFNLNIKKKDDTFVKIDAIFSPIFDYKNHINSFVINGKSAQPENAAIQETEDLDNYKTKPDKSLVDFIGNIFHEILTPVNVIMGFADELAADDSSISKEQKELSGILKQNRSFLLQAMNSSVELSSLEYNNQEPEITEFKITEIVDQLNEDFKRIKGEKNVTFAFGKISSSLSFKSDKSKFYTLISNLLIMVVRLTEEKKIYLSASQIDKDKFSITIKDGYSYFSSELLGRLQEIFEKKDISKVKNSGISKMTARLVFKLLNILHGEVVFSKINNALSTVDFVFPIKFSEYNENDINKTENSFEETKDQLSSDSSYNVTEFEKIEHSKEDKEVEDENSNEIDSVMEENDVEEDAEVDFTKLKCLYIEDQLDAQTLFKIEMNNFKRVDYAMSFEDALPYLENNGYDVIFIDINLMGDYNGLDALKMIRKIKQYERIPIVAVSAYLIPGDKEKYISTGFDDFIDKPLLHGKVSESLSRIFKDLISS